MFLRRALPLLALAAVIPAAHAQYTQVNLISDGSIPAAHFDPNLVNAWGLAFSPTGPFWINDNGTGLSTVYDTTGAPYPPGHPLIVDVAPVGSSAPTGIAFNGTAGFQVTNGLVTKPSIFVFVTENGVISGWNPNVDGTTSITAVDNIVPDSVYKGAAMATSQGQQYLYATNFSNGTVDVFDSSWNLAGSFTDPNVPTDYAPFGIANVHGYLVVTFAEREQGGDDDVPGPGHGVVDVFLPNGHLLKRLVTGRPLNSPWGVALAPHHFGQFHDHLLIGNFGDGRINAFDLSGHFDGPLRQNGRGHQPIEIEGLWAIAVGNGHLGGDADKLYFTAGPEDESHGLFGYIAANRGRR